MITECDLVVDLSDLNLTEKYILVEEEYSRFDENQAVAVGTGQEILDFLSKELLEEGEKFSLKKLQCLLDGDGDDSYRIYEL